MINFRSYTEEVNNIYKYAFNWDRFNSDLYLKYLKEREKTNVITTLRKVEVKNDTYIGHQFIKAGTYKEISNLNLDLGLFQDVNNTRNRVALNNEDLKILNK